MYSTFVPDCADNRFNLSHWKAKKPPTIDQLCTTTNTPKLFYNINQAAERMCRTNAPDRAQQIQLSIVLKSKKVSSNRPRLPKVLSWLPVDTCFAVTWICYQTVSHSLLPACGRYVVEGFVLKLLLMDAVRCPWTLHAVAVVLLLLLCCCRRSLQRELGDGKFQQKEKRSISSPWGTLVVR